MKKRKPDQRSEPEKLRNSNFLTFDARALGWKKDSAHCKARMLSKKWKCYVTFYYIFHVVTFVRSKKLWSSTYAPYNYPDGYWLQGEYKTWTSARKDRYYNLCLGASDK